MNGERVTFVLIEYEPMEVCRKRPDTVAEGATLSGKADCIWMAFRRIRESGAEGATENTVSLKSLRQKDGMVERTMRKIMLFLQGERRSIPLFFFLSYSESF